MLVLPLLSGLVCHREIFQLVFLVGFQRFFRNILVIPTMTTPRRLIWQGVTKKTSHINTNATVTLGVSNNSVGQTLKVGCPKVVVFWGHIVVFQPQTKRVSVSGMFFFTLFKWMRSS